MKNFRLLVQCLLPIAFCLIIGCQPTQQVGEELESEIHAVWESPLGKNHWRFSLLDGGILSEVTRNDAQRMVISEGGLYVESPELTLRYVFGPCKWSFDKDTNILKVTITLNDYYVKVSENEINCTLIDTFEGPVSSDGKTWIADWTTTMKYDQNVPDRIDSVRRVLFKKLLND